MKLYFQETNLDGFFLYGFTLIGTYTKKADIIFTPPDWPVMSGVPLCLGGDGSQARGQSSLQGPEGDRCGQEGDL